MINAAVLGSPISHSLSPHLHRAAYDLLEISGHYQAFDVPSGTLHNFLDSQHDSFDGFSLTMPLKEEAIVECKELSVDASLLTAVNTMIRIGDFWHGHNTDVLGFEYLLRFMNEEEVAILGAGGTARAALLAARRLGLTTHIFRRNPVRDSALRAIDHDVQIHDWKEAGTAFSMPILINSTPSGSLEGELSIRNGVVIDAIYAPWPSLLSQSCPPQTRFISGIELLSAQAVYQIRLMTGKDFDLERIHQHLVAVGRLAINNN